MGTKQFDNYADLITFTRSSRATLLDSDGLLKRAGHNLLTYSEEFTDSDWSKQSNVTFTSNADTAPDGTLTADKYNISSSSQRAFFQSKTFSNTEVTFSFWIKAIVDTSIYLYLTSESINISVADGWQRISRTAVVNGTLSFGFYDNSGDIGDRFFVWGAHLYRSDMPMVPNRNSGWTAETTYYPTTSAAYEAPRIEYDADGNRLGLLVEEQRTNLVTYSNDFSTSWVATAISQTVNQIGPDGVSNSATTVTASGTTSYYYIGAGTTAGTATGSVFVKSGTANVIWLYWNSGASNGRAYFDLSDESVQAEAGSSQTPTNLQIQKFGDFYRVSASWVVTTGTTNFGFGSANAKGSLTTTSGNSLIIYGAQLETGSFPTSYIPTSGSTATRAADVATIPASAFGYNASEGTVYIELGSPRGTALAIGDSTFNNDLRFASQNLARGVGGGFSKTVILGTYLNQLKLAVAMKEDDYAGIAQGASLQTDTNASMPPAPNNFYIGADYGSYLNGHIKSIKYYPRRLSNAQLQELTQ